MKSNRVDIWKQAQWQVEFIPEWRANR